MLESFGFRDVANVKGGFSGLRDPLGRVAEPGWADAGLPVAVEAPPGLRYDDLLAKANG